MDTGNPQALTPVQQHQGVWFKRDDTYAVGGSLGGKVRTCLALATAAQQAGAHTLVTAGSRHSPQVNIVTDVANHLGMAAQVHTPTGPLTPELLAAQAGGAVVVQHRPGHNSVIKARARVAADAPGHAHIPFGMECGTAVTATATQVRNLPAAAKRLVVPVGSGMSLAGILHGLEAAGRAPGDGGLPVLGVTVGADPTKRLDVYAPVFWRQLCTLVPATLPYNKVPTGTYWGTVSLDPHYEAKCLDVLKPGDVLWVVGRRATAAPDGVPGN